MGALKAKGLNRWRKQRSGKSMSLRMHFKPFTYSITSILRKVVHPNTLFLTISFAFPCRPLGALVRFTCGGGGKGAHHSQCSLSQPNVQKNSRAHVRGKGGGLKISKHAGKNKQAHTKEKKGHRFPCILYFFIHPQPNNISPARQQPRALFSIFLSLVG